MRKISDPAAYYGKVRPMSFEVMFWNNRNPGPVIADVFHKDDEDSMGLVIGHHSISVTIEEMTAIRDALSMAIAARIERDRAGSLTVGDEEI